MQKIKFLFALLFLTGSITADAVEITFGEVSQKIFRPKCVECHSASDPSGDFNIQKYESVLQRVKPGNPDESKLYQKVKSGDMPFLGDPLSTEELALVKQWILDGAKDDPVSGKMELKTVVPAFGTVSGGTEITLEGEHLDKVKKVNLGSEPCTNLKVISAKKLTCLIPRSSKEAVVDVIAESTESKVVLEKAFRYNPDLAASYHSLFVNIIEPRCVKCHSGEKPPKGLDLSDFDSMMAHDRAIVPFDAKKSRVYKKTREGEMPKGGKPLTKEELAYLAKWINAGAHEN